MKMFIELHERELSRDTEPGIYNINFIEEILPAVDENGDEYSELFIRGHYVGFHETKKEIRQMIATCQGGMPVHPWGYK